MSDAISTVISSVYGRRFSHANVGNFKSLSFVFCETTRHINIGNNDFEWKIGTYYCSWRILKEGKVILGSNDSNDIAFLNDKVGRIEFDKIVAITNYSVLDIQVIFENGMVVNFINTISDKDETFHMLCPNNMYVKFTTEGIWMIGPSDLPWPDSSSSPEGKTDKG